MSLSKCLDPLLPQVQENIFLCAALVPDNPEYAELTQWMHCTMFYLSSTEPKHFNLVASPREALKDGSGGF